jgi:hypothetical protein
MLLTELGWLVVGEGNVVGWDVDRRLECDQKEMERDNNQNFPTVILSFLMGERQSAANVP